MQHQHAEQRLFEELSEYQNRFQYFPVVSAKSTEAALKLIFLGVCAEGIKHSAPIGFPVLPSALMGSTIEKQPSSAEPLGMKVTELEAVADEALSESLINVARVTSRRRPWNGIDVFVWGRAFVESSPRD